MIGRSVYLTLIATVAGITLMPGVGRAQAAPITAEQAEAAFRKTGRELRRFELVVLGRLEEVTPLGLLEGGHSERQARELAASEAEAAYQKAGLDVEVAEVEVKLYDQGVVPQETQTIEGEITLAKSDIERAEDEVKELKALSDRLAQAADKEEPHGLMRAYSLRQWTTGADLLLQKAKYSLEIAQTKKLLFEKFTKGKRQKELAADVEKAKSLHLRKKGDFYLAKDRVAALDHGRGTPLTRAEWEILGRLDDLLATWKKAVALQGGPEAKRAEFVALVADVEARRSRIEHDWNEAQEARLVERDELVTQRIRQVLKRPAAR